MAKINKKQARKTALLVMCEGLHDKAFFLHMKDAYNSRKSGVKVETADGGSAYDIVNSAIKKTRHIGYDSLNVFMDSDDPEIARARKLAREKKVNLIESTPVCLEGMLLEILGKNAEIDSQRCKAKLHPELSGCPTQKGSYSPKFDKPILDASNKPQIEELKKLLEN